MSTSLDEQWFTYVHAIGGQVSEAAWFQKLITISPEEKEQFLNNETENPHFVHHAATSTPTSALEIEQLQEQINSQEKDAVVLDLYTHKLTELTQKSHLLQVFLAQDDIAFHQTSVQLYGKPKKKYFSYVAQRITRLCDAAQTQAPGAAKRLRRLVSKIDQSNTDISADILPPPLESDQVVASVDEVVRIFEATLDRLEITGWSVQVDTDSTRNRFAVSSYSQTIHIPNQAQLLLRSRKLTRLQIEALAEHEIGVHVRRTHEGAISPLKLLQVGLDDYLPGEEGLAGYVQQQIEGANEFYGLDQYFAVCLAMGMDGTKRDFRAVFSSMLDYYTLKFASRGMTDAVPFRAAWDVCKRIFRGTSGRTPGAVYTKDIVYLEGNIGIWHLISDQPDVFESLFLGKFNPLIPRHVKSLQTLGILKQW